MRIGSADYKLLEFHFHALGEEPINGVYYLLNAHLVHTSSARQVRVIGVSFKVGLPMPI